MKYANLQFFNKEGLNLNFNYVSESDMWEGSMYFKEISTGLFSIDTLRIVEKIKVNSKLRWNIPIYKGDSTDKKWTASFYQENAFSIFRVLQSNEVELLKNYEIFPRYDSTGYLGTDGYWNSNQQVKLCLDLNLSFMSEDEDTFTNILYIKDEDDSIICKIFLYGENVGEDERLNIISSNLGINLTEEDFKIFLESDIDEDLTDFQLLNRKRKESLLEIDKIWFYRGNYKSLINALKFFGYQNIGIREFYQNIDPTSKNFGKIIMSKPIDFELSNKNKNIQNSATFRKTGLLNLFYRINLVTDEFNEDGTPVVKNISDFSSEVIFKKIWKLKEKLNKEFIPISSRIRDITGEGDYFASYSIDNTLEKNKTLTTFRGVNAEFDAVKKIEYLRDLREPFLNTEDVTGVIRDIFIGNLNNTIKIGDRVIYEVSGSEPIEVTSILGRYASADVGLNYTVEDLSDFIVAYFTKNYPFKIKNQDDSKVVPYAPFTLNCKSFPNLNWKTLTGTWSKYKKDESTGEISSLFTWKRIKYGISSEIEWIIKKDISDISPGFYLNIRGDVEEYENVNIFLPYVGKYSVELRIYDMYGNVSLSLIPDFLEVKPYDLEFIGWYRKRKRKYTYKDIGNQVMSKTGSNWKLPIKINQPYNRFGNISWRSLNLANYIPNNQNNEPNQTVMNYRPDGTVSYQGPWYWKNLKNLKWKDLDHVWWSATSYTGDIKGYFEILKVVPGDELVIRKGKTLYKRSFSTLEYDLETAAFYLNQTKSKFFNRFIYNLIKDEYDNPIKIIAVAKHALTWYNFDEIYVNSFESSDLTEIGEWKNAVIRNPRWSDLIVFNNFDIMQKGSHIAFSFDTSSIVGKKWDDTYWTLKNVSNPNFKDKYIRSRYFSWLFDEEGTYVLKLETQDNNGNKYSVEKNILIIQQ
mgnify:CR=1 FL=1